MLSGKAARLSMSLILLEWKCSMCCFSSIRVVVKEASLCRRNFVESDSRLKTQTVGRIDARETPTNSKSSRRCWCGQRGRQRRGNNVCIMTSGSTCRTLRMIAPTDTTVPVTGERHWRSLPCSTHFSQIFSPARFMLDGQWKLRN